MKILFSGVQRTEAEKVFTVVRNVDADSITSGMGVRYVGGAPAENVSADGIQCVKISKADDELMIQFAGIAVEDIIADGYGLVQNFGVVDSIMLSHVGTSITIGTFGGIRANGFLQVGARNGTFFSGGASFFIGDVSILPRYNTLQAWATVGVSTESLAFVKGFVRVL